MMQIIRCISECYFNNSDFAQSIVGIVLMLFVVIEGVRCLLKSEKYIINDWLQYIIVSIGAILAGKLLVLFKVPIVDISPIYKIMLFLNGFIFIVVGVAIQGLIHKKIDVAARQLFKYISYLVFATYFLLSLTKSLDFLEWFDGVLLIVGFEIGTRMVEKKVKEAKKKKERDANYAKYDHSNPDLYGDRKKQLDRFINNLNEMEKEPYGIMISGEWGCGKSSFIEALEERLKESIFIEIDAGAEKSITEIMKELSNQILEILRVNDIYVEDRSIINEYFSAFSTVAEQTENSFLMKLFRNRKKEYVDEKQYLNERLLELDKTIYIIIDDLDRCEEEHQDKAFKVIRECTALKNCKTIFLVDKSQFLIKYNGKDYLEKYFSDSINLVKVNYHEIFEKHRDLYSMSESALLLMYDLPYQIIEDLEKRIASLEERLESKVVDETEEIHSKIAGLKKALVTIENNLCNSRKVKQYFRGVEKALEILIQQRDFGEAELKGANWEEVIVRVHILKRFLPQNYSEIEMLGRIQDYAEYSDSSAIAIALGREYLFSFPDEKDLIMINEIIYHWDALDLENVRTEKARYIQNLSNNIIEKREIEKYIEYAEGFTDLQKIFEMYVPSCQTDEERKVFLDICFVKIERILESRILDNLELLAFSNDFVSNLVLINTTRREQRVYEEKCKRVAEEIIRQNSIAFRDVMMLTEGPVVVRDNWKAVSDIKTLYSNLYSIDMKYFKRIANGKEDTSKKIRQYYEELEAEFNRGIKEEEFNKFSSLFSRVQTLLVVYDIWSNVDTQFYLRAERKEASLEDYFQLGNSYNYKDTVFENVESLQKAYNAYYTFLVSLSQEEYDIAYEGLLVKILLETVCRAEENMLWFGEDYPLICSYVKIIVKKLNQFIKHDEAAMAKINIFSYRLDCLNAFGLEKKDALP